MKNVYFVNGFLDAGKTTFIKDLLEQEYFDTGERTLLLLCEDGDTEYEEPFNRKHNIIIRWIKEESDFTEQNIQRIESEVQPERIIVEFNGMWDSDRIADLWKKDKVLEIVLINAKSFDLYMNNMKSYVTRQIRSAYMTIFRSCDGMEDKLAGFRRSIRAVNPQTNFVFKDKNGEMNPRLDEDLPYDIQAGFLDLNDRAFGIFYIDAMEYVERYVGKTVCFTGYIFKKKKSMLLIGRQAMTCCMEDLETFAFICDISDADDFEYNDWVRIEGVVKKEYFEQINAEIPVIDIMWIEECNAPEEKIINVN